MRQLLQLRCVPRFGHCRRASRANEKSRKTRGVFLLFSFRSTFGRPRLRPIRRKKLEVRCQNQLEQCTPLPIGEGQGRGIWRNHQGDVISRPPHGRLLFSDVWYRTNFPRRQAAIQTLATQNPLPCGRGGSLIDSMSAANSL